MSYILPPDPGQGTSPGAGLGGAGGHWHLGRWSKPGERGSPLPWTVFICSILVMPPNQVVGETMPASGWCWPSWYFWSASGKPRARCCMAYRIGLRIVVSGS